jgi:hypothetical protein
MKEAAAGRHTRYEVEGSSLMLIHAAASTVGTPTTQDFSSVPFRQNQNAAKSITRRRKRRPVAGVGGI